MHMHMLPYHATLESVLVKPYMDALHRGCTVPRPRVRDLYVTPLQTNRRHIQHPLRLTPTHHVQEVGVHTREGGHPHPFLVPHTHPACIRMVFAHAPYPHIKCTRRAHPSMHTRTACTCSSHTQTHIIPCTHKQTKEGSGMGMNSLCHHQTGVREGGVGPVRGVPGSVTLRLHPVCGKEGACMHTGGGQEDRVHTQ